MNQNDFPVKIKLSTQCGHKDKLPNLPLTVRLAANSIKSVNIKFFGATPGKFFTIINAIVNIHHCIPIMFNANIEPLHLRTNITEVIINLNDVNTSSTISIINNLNVPVHYTWLIPTGSCFVVVPKSGIVPKNRYILSEVFYQQDFSNRSSTKLTLKCYNGSIFNISATAYAEQIETAMKETVIDIPHIPLNIEYTRYATIINRGYSPVLFSIRNPNPTPGLQIHPTDGLIPRRSYQVLKIKILMKVIAAFKCSIDVVIHNTNDSLKFDITGKVDFPSLLIEPDAIRLKRIAAGSFDCSNFSLTNTGKSDIKVNYVQDISPEFSIVSLEEIDKTKTITEIYLPPGSKETFTLNYFPIDVTMIRFYFPFIINDILGPPLCKEDVLNPSIYLSENEE